MKKLIRKVARSLGYDISRVSIPSNNNVKGMLRFGPYQIESRCALQIDTYARYPAVNQFLGRLVAFFDDSSDEFGIIDVGANCGDTAALMRSQTSLPILCVEGDLKLFGLLELNMRQCPNITLLNAYVGESTGPMSVKIEKIGWNNTLIPIRDSTETVKIFRLDELSHPWLINRKIRLIKIDTEGFDIAILFGAKNLLARSQPVVVFEYNRDNLDAIAEPGMRVFNYLDSLGYEGLLIYDSPGRYLMSTTVQNIELLAELHGALQPPTNHISYLDFVAFPKTEAALFRKFRDLERSIHSPSPRPEVIVINNAKVAG
jgi:FkbM family methyltransferase